MESHLVDVFGDMFYEYNICIFADEQMITNDITLNCNRIDTVARLLRMNMTIHIIMTRCIIYFENIRYKQLIHHFAM